ncbi:MAG: tRNA pseudouridine(38-40) synthase TruA [Clostridiales bacterium]|nr:tRNA pseudouridine(38-40) synthase TruA [Clostridiales bacterium]
MNNYKLTIQYDGGRYKGWQRLGNNENTIQGKIEKVLSLMAEEKITIIGCSRTDAGVHAIGQVANFKTNKKFTEQEVKQYLNRYLPTDISIVAVQLVPDDFHSRYHAKAKTYRYQIWNKEYSNPFLRKYSMHIEEALNINAMRLASRHFIGSHDFTAFSNAKSKKKSMVRELYSIDIQEEDGLLVIHVKGNGFLYNMARWIVGTLIDVGLGKLEANQIPAIIASKERNKTGRLADAQGLYLESIEYN